MYSKYKKLSSTRRKRVSRGRKTRRKRVSRRRITRRKRVSRGRKTRRRSIRRMIGGSIETIRLNIGDILEDSSSSSKYIFITDINDTSIIYSSYVDGEWKDMFLRGKIFNGGIWENVKKITIDDLPYDVKRTL